MRRRSGILEYNMQKAKESMNSNNWSKGTALS